MELDRLSSTCPDGSRDIFILILLYLRFRTVAHILRQIREPGTRSTWDAEGDACTAWPSLGVNDVGNYRGRMPVMVGCRNGYVTDDVFSLQVRDQLGGEPLTAPGCRTVPGPR